MDPIHTGAPSDISPPLGANISVAAVSCCERRKAEVVRCSQIGQIDSK